MAKNNRFANCYKHLNRKGQPNSDERSNIYTLKTNARKDWKQSVHTSKFNFNDSGNRLCRPPMEKINLELANLKKHLGNSTSQSLVYVIYFS